MYFEAASLMDAEGISRMALCLSEGIGCKQDIAGAIVVYKQALLLGDSIAAYNLGTIYRDLGKYRKHSSITRLQCILTYPIIPLRLVFAIIME